MKFKLPLSRKSGQYYTPVSSSVRSPSCSSSDGVLDDAGNAPYAFNVRRLSEDNKNYRISLWTGKNLQLTAMSVLPMDECGEERYGGADRMILVTSGYGEVETVLPNGEKRIFSLSDGYAVIVPSGAVHRVRNTGRCPLRFYSAFTHPVLPYGTKNQMKC